MSAYVKSLWQVFGETLKKAGHVKPEKEEEKRKKRTGENKNIDRTYQVWAKTKVNVKKKNPIFLQKMWKNFVSPPTVAEQEKRSCMLLGLTRLPIESFSLSLKDCSCKVHAKRDANERQAIYPYPSPALCWKMLDHRVFPWPVGLALQCQLKDSSKLTSGQLASTLRPVPCWEKPFRCASGCFIPAGGEISLSQEWLPGSPFWVLGPSV